MKGCYTALSFLCFFILNVSNPGCHLFAQMKVWTLKECLIFALENNIQLNQTQLTSKLYKINYDQAKAALYPSFSVSDQQSFDFGNSIDLYNDKSTRKNTTGNNLALSGNVTLFNGFLLRNTMKQSKFIYNAGNFDVEKMKNDINLNVIAGYLQILYSYKALEIAKNQLSITATLVEKTQKLVDGQKLAEGNLLQIQSQLSVDKASVVAAENQLQLAKVSLMQLMEMPIVDDFEIDTALINEPSVVNTGSAGDIFKISEGIMPEIKSAEFMTKANETTIKIARAAYLPKLSLAGYLNTSYSSGSKLLSASTTFPIQDIGYLQSNPSERVLGIVPVTVTQEKNYPVAEQFRDNFGQAITLNLSVPIFNSFQAKYGVAKARLNLQNAQLEEEAVRVQLRKLVEQAYTDLAIAEKNFLAAQDILISEERSYKDMERKFNLGMVSATDFLIEKNNYNKTLQSLVQAKYTYIFKSKIVDFYLGKPIN